MELAKDVSPLNDAAACTTTRPGVADHKVAEETPDIKQDSPISTPLLCRLRLHKYKVIALVPIAGRLMCKHVCANCGKTKYK